MRKPWIILLSVITVVLLLTSCKPRSIGDIIGKLIDAENNNIEAGLEQGSALQPGQYVVLKWPSWVPSSIPKYTYGDLYAAQQFDQQSGSLLLTNIDMKKDAFHRYVKELEKKGWVEEEGWQGPERDNQYIIHMTHPKDKLFLIYDIVVEEDEVHGRINYSDDSTSYEEEESDNGFFTEEITNPDGSLAGIISNEQVPDSYPHDFCPLYPGSYLESSQVNYAGDDMDTYTVTLLSKDGKDKISGFYKGNSNFSMTFGDYSILLENGDRSMSATIQIGDASDEHLKQEYMSFIMMNIMVEK